ncbi:hypothetical protein KC332_g13681 [Hortaea werneckii]|uniref:Uncharacterized protein n=2 Tax=Hortaea werneckii TaxID=91943 RepID=A0A3M7ID43_HORWE|nr:hypothetical protein KC358_g13713 [Hortaea werneckii]OTA31513.1 hypothetical protein BTJ68_08283 [Hortaea werneckii EXF-2000]KAI6808330.1 hypothetical protein KC350_g13375 [Hortaea werneckii]KAI6908940.1 hypothetical protein KC348_g13666 [Hortaea werneckii]KAI6925446.1 hypothetical protein KC341_g13414 [Hortaea werneckii]
MSDSTTTTTNPIDPARFALALESLPIDSLHAKAAEIQNSIAHLRSSNAQMLPFAEEQDDQDCKEAMFENLTVIGRMNERIRLLKAEVERRGLPWAPEGEGENGVGAAGNVDGEGEAVVVVNGDGSHGGERRQGGAWTVNSAVGGETTQPRAPSGRLTDEELRRQLEAQMDGDADAGDEGVHL